ncbi:unnamed protein product [Peronospora belbahrii]|uniref:RING-type domain-containing protein n=1 Tax=Peronospora belbahrii TaxID=622444 RepID=A0AAU9LLM9_9STRA|nr:unnamed protein product [Peronospora belbahrii]CAH0518812.1 unnamed protein product [Peronospora belbahrii]
MEYGRLVVLGYSSYRVDMVQRPCNGNFELSSPTFGLAEAASSDAAALSTSELASSSSSTSFASRKRLFWKPLGGQNAHFVLEKRSQANGVRLHRFHHVVPVAEFQKQRQGGSRDIKSVTTRIMDRIEAAGSCVSDDIQTQKNGSSPIVSYQMCIPMNDKDPFASVTEFHADTSADMFQIGRMPCRHNDFVIPGPRVGASGTISRYAARIVCSRDPPFECRLFAGGFDAARRMSTAGNALKYCARCGLWSKSVGTDHTCVMQKLMEDVREDTRDQDMLSLTKSSSNRSRGDDVVHYIEDTREDGLLEHLALVVQKSSQLPLDGLTKNGVRMWLPEQKQWFEVSVNGSLFAIESRAVDEKASLLSSRSNGTDRRCHDDRAPRSRSGAFNRPTGSAENLAPILTDGTIIDLGGVQLQFQTSYQSELEAKTENSQLLEAPVLYSRTTLSSIRTQLERLNVHCPVQLDSLRFTRAAPGEEVPLNTIPHVFPACGHVLGYEKRIASVHICPLCRTPGSLVQLLFKENSQLQSVEEQHAIPECVFNPCGHAISSKLAHHYSTLLMPNGRAICPFCAMHLDLRVPFSRLYLYYNSD